MPRLPSFQFYPADWLTDANLRRCSAQARAVWIDMLCLMFQCEKRGILTTNGNVWTDEQIAESIPGDTYKNLLALKELLGNHVARRNDQGAVYSKRMLADEKERQRWRQNKQNQRVKDFHPYVSTNSRPSSSSSSSSNLSQDTKIISRRIEVSAFEQFWAVYPNKIGEPAARQAWCRIPFIEAHSEEVIAGVHRWMTSARWSDPQYIPDPKTFLKERRWQDEPPKTGATKHEQRTRKTLEVLKRAVGDNQGSGPMRPPLPDRAN